jgi:hypothetical protein
MNWLACQAIDLWGKLAHAYYTRKYRALARHLGRPLAPPEPERRPGFILIQIDGLAHEHLRLALECGLMPHLKQTLDSGQARMSRWQCGLPSTTPAIQAGLFYGDKSDIPGFRWYDKEHRASVVVKRPDQVRVLTHRLRGNGRGLLHGGSSYTNFFDGDADLSLFTVSTLGRFHFFENVRGIGFLLLFLLSPMRVARVLFHSAREYLRDLGRRIAGLFRPLRVSGEHLLSPLYRIMVDVLFGELLTFGIMLDIYRGVPSVSANFTSYDELAHHWGPDHHEALRALKRIDAQIHQVDRMRRLYHRRQYDLYILSDHGLSASVTFQSQYGKTLGRLISESMGKPITLDEQAGHEAQSLDKARFLLDELQAWEEQRGHRPRLARVLRRARTSLDRRIPPDLERAAHDLERRSDVVVRSSGGLAHVYFNLSPQRLTLSEIVWLYPRLLAQLLDHPGLGLLVGREGEQIIVMGKQGSRVITKSTLSTQSAGASSEILDQDPLCGLDDPESAAKDLAQLAMFPHSGDLILLGAWDGEGNVVTFEEQLGTHGGLGGAQGRPFIIHPTDTPLDSIALAGPCDLYVHFMANYVTRNV